MSVPTVYATLKSKTGILRELMREAIFGPRYAKAVEVLAHATDPVQSIALSAAIARAIYEGESAELSLLMNASAFSPELRKLQLEFEQIRLDLQRDRVEQLFEHARARKGLDREHARHVLWMLTSRDVYRMLVHESGWSADVTRRGSRIRSCGCSRILATAPRATGAGSCLTQAVREFRSTRGKGETGATQSRPNIPRRRCSKPLRGGRTTMRVTTDFGFDRLLAFDRATSAAERL